MKKHSVLILSVALFALFLRGSLCYAQERAVAIVLSSDIGFYKNVSDGFRAYFAGMGNTINASEYNLKTQNPENIISQISSTKPGLILAVGGDAMKLLKGKLPEIPRVLVSFEAKQMAEDNSAGVCMEIPPEMKISGIKNTLPNVKVVGMLYSPYSIDGYLAIKSECEKRGLTLKAKIVNTNAEFMDAFNSVSSGVDCFLFVLDPKIYFGQTVKLVLLQGQKNKVPVIGLSSFFTKSGAMLSIDCDYNDIGLQSGEIASRLFGGEKASDVKFVYPRKYQYSLNTLVAKTIGATIPSGVINQASEVFDK
jgi:putative ABC transport system substrate-binding protein